MKKKGIIIGTIVVVVGVGFLFRDSLISSGTPVSDALQYPKNSGATKENIAQIREYAYTELFEHPVFHFSFLYPESFSVTRIPEESGGEAILVQDLTRSIGAQILVTPFDEEELDLTVDAIKAGIPDMKIKDAREVIIGANRKGLAFQSDSEAFGGTSREVWFVFRGNLYQISTYAELDAFLQGLFGTWQFR